MYLQDGSRHANTTQKKSEVTPGKIDMKKKKKGRGVVGGGGSRTPEMKRILK